MQQREGEKKETYIIQHDKRLCPSAIGIANGIKKPTPSNCGQQLLDKQRQKRRADSSQDKVVYQKERLELERLPVPHQLAATKDDEIVDGDKDGRVPQRGHWRLANDKVKLLGRIASHIFKGLAEERPEADAKGPVDGGKRQRARHGSKSPAPERQLGQGRRAMNERGEGKEEERRTKENHDKRKIKKKREEEKEKEGRKKEREQA